MSENQQPDPKPSDSSDEETIGAREPGSSEALERDPKDWASREDPMTEAQRSYLDTLAKKAGEELPADLNKGQASEHIDRLQEKNG